MAIITYTADDGWQLIAPDGSPLSARSYRKASDAEAEARRRGLRVLNACGSRRASCRSRSAWLSRRPLALLGECVAGLGVIALVACGAPFVAVVAGLAALAACGWVAVGA